MEARISKILDQLDAATIPQDLNLPGYKFHGLKGPLKSRYAVTVSGNLRITFGFEGHNAVDINLEDYH